MIGQIKLSFVDVEPRPIHLGIGIAPNSNTWAAFRLTKKNQWLLSIAWGGTAIEATCDAVDGEEPVYIYALMMRRVVALYAAVGVTLPVISAVPSPDETEVL